METAAAGPSRPFDAFSPELAPQTPLRAAITAAWRLPEPEAVPPLLAAARCPPAQAAQADALARRIASTLRARKASAGRAGLVQGLLQEFALSSQEGVALMCLAEALLRIPDAATRDALIRDKIAQGQWQAHLGRSPSLFVNAATWGLLFTGRLVATHSEAGLSAALGRLVAKGGEPLIRKGVDMAMRLMGEQFVTGETIDEALAHARPLEAAGFRYSYDMLGEAALTAADAARYLQDYERAIHAIGRAARGRGIYDGPGISIKLSALHPRYARAQAGRVGDELYPVLRGLAVLARGYDIGLNIDAEEADRLELSLDLLERLCAEPALAGWNGIGFVVQAYQKRCPFVIDHLIDLARRSGHRLMVRLVKGAYWDSEIKRAQLDGLAGYPVYTRKPYTDVAYIACARKLLAAPDAVYPQFATHNAHTLAALYTLADPAAYHPGQYEFQCLHGMGEPLYEQVVGAPADGKLGRPCRIYAPVGTHETLLAYLVRRLLENGANTSFVNRVADPAIPLDALVEDPVRAVERLAAEEGAVGGPHPAIPLPADLYGAARRNSLGLDLASDAVLADLLQALRSSADEGWTALPLLAATPGVPTTSGDLSRRDPPRRDPPSGDLPSGDPPSGDLPSGDLPSAEAQVGATQGAETQGGGAPVTESRADRGAAAGEQLARNPADGGDIVGRVCEATPAEIEGALEAAAQAAPGWAATLPAERAAALDRAADDLQQALPYLLGLLVREAGKTCANAVSEVREAIDFLRYYAAQARREFGPATHRPLGPVVCISPWNFPLAIFTGQVAAALAAGNPVLAKPAEQTPLIAAEAVRALWRAGVPRAALQLLPGRGESVGAALVADARTMGVMFTGSTEVARLLQRSLAGRLGSDGAPVPLIAETGGQNAMIVDSSALAEQVVADVVASAFDSAGQRCSALRVLCVQDDVADRLLEMLRGAMAELRVGDPSVLATDLGPVIDGDALQAIERHVQAMRARGRAVHRACHPASTPDARGSFVLPTLIELDSLAELDREIFGPVLHVVRYRRRDLDDLLGQINATGYGLTLGLHTRIDETIEHVVARARVGNAYVNRNMVGAVVGVQPFGGEGLSGTGPKAGGPLYLYRLLSKRPAGALGHALQPDGAPAPLPSAGDAALQALRAWAAANGRDRLADAAARYAAECTAIDSARPLSGPTGERNLYRVVPREAVLGLAADDGDRLLQLAATLAVGSRAVWPLEAAALRERLPPEVRERIALARDWVAPGVAFDAVLHHGSPEALREACRQVAARPGPIVAVQGYAPGDAALALERLVVERALSVNTAAAGGNATLMTIG